MLITEPNNLVFLETYNTEFDIAVTFTEQNSRLLEIEDKVDWHYVLINKDDTLFNRTKNNKLF